MTSVSDRAAIARTVPARRHYRNAPIVEMVLEIAVELSPRPPEIDLRRFGEREKGFTFENELHQFESQFDFDASKPVLAASASTRQELLGYQFRNSADNRIITVRFNGLSFSKLQPYSSWDEVRPEAEAVWARYAQTFPIQRILSLGVRYINRLDLPLPVENLKDWVLTGPDIAPGISQEIAGFTMELQLPQRDLGRTLATVRQAVVVPARKGVVSIALDIDLRRQLDATPADSASLWTLIRDLHDRENVIFESSVTDRLRALID